MTNRLYQVTERIYQVRGYDLSNMDIIEGNTRLIIIDPLISKETAKAALDLYFQHRPKKTVVAVIYTHSHVDHYGGAMPLDMYLDYLGMRIDGKKADGKHIVLNLNLTDTHQQYVLKLENSVLIYTPDKKLDKADASVSLPRTVLDQINLGETTFEAQVKKGTVKVEGDSNKLKELFGLLVTFNPHFNIITPNA